MSPRPPIIIREFDLLGDPKVEDNAPPSNALLASCEDAVPHHRHRRRNSEDHKDVLLLLLLAFEQSGHALRDVATFSSHVGVNTHHTLVNDKLAYWSEPIPDTIWEGDPPEGYIPWSAREPAEFLGLRLTETGRIKAREVALRMCATAAAYTGELE